MKHIFFSRIILITALVLCSFSCTSDLDFEQANDFSAKPVITMNLAYIKGNAPDFVENSAELTTFSYVAQVSFFDSSLVNNNLVKAELYFRIKNNINKAFTFDIDLKEDSGVVVRNIKIEVPASINGNEVVVDPTIIFNESETDDLRRTTQMAFTVTMHSNSGPPLTEDSPGRVELSSSITAYFDIK